MLIKNECLVLQNNVEYHFPIVEATKNYQYVCDIEINCIMSEVAGRLFIILGYQIKA
jgi:hypothetical protein